MNRHDEILKNLRDYAEKTFFTDRHWDCWKVSWKLANIASRLYPEQKYGEVFGIVDRVITDQIHKELDEYRKEKELEERSTGTE